MSHELDRTAAACLFPGFDGTEASDWLLRWLERGLGGVVLFARNIESRDQVVRLTGALRAERSDLLVATDEEGGDVTRLEARAGSSYPGNWALGVVDDPNLTEEIAAAIAGDLATVGINFDFAPVADVNSNPDNPVIGIRAFGSDPRRVSRHVAAFVAGLHRRFVAACAKHFPGHGDTAQDSHLELPVVQGDITGALEPFRAAIDAGVRSIMTAHVVVPELADAPATHSREILQGLLREELGFGGVAMTDALEMRAISSTVGVEEGAVQALAAGADALCLGADVDDGLVSSVHSAIVAAATDGRLSTERLDEAAGRVAELAHWASQASGDEGRRDLGREAAERALLAEGTVALTRPPLVLELRPEPSIAAGAARHGLADVLDGAYGAVLTSPRSAPELLAGHEDRQPVVVIRDAHRHQWERQVLEAVLAIDPETVVVETGLPLWRPQDAAYIATHGGGRANLQAAASALSR
jgi:beta-N-acetylhexosaminidase